MKKIISNALAFLFIVYSYSQNQVSVAKTPSWVDIQEYNVEPNIDEEEITQGNLSLLADYQINIPEQEYYFRLVNKITENVGIQSASQISAIYDPLYQKLIFHSIKVIRDGKEINKLFPEHFQLIRRELNAENYLYDGSLSAILNMSDVRNGDIVDCSYTVKGFNPMHKGKYSDSFILNDYVPIGKINVSINAKNKLNYKLYNKEVQPKITIKNGYTNYNWRVVTPDKFLYEESIPPSKIVMPTVIVTDYTSWKEVVNWAYNIYKKKEPLNSSVKSKIAEIIANNKTEGSKIKAILDFVQDDVRYLGLEQGIGGYKPNLPNKVFTQRYGDCKDKSLLMVEMLQEINIEAYPMLVNTNMKDGIVNLPPSPTLFNHCVVKVIDKKGREIYYDPTFLNQGGTYKNTHFPNYKNGLVVKKNNVAFDTIISSSNNNITTLEEFVVKEINGGATLKVTNTYEDIEADNMRNFFKNNSKTSIKKECENFYAKYYPKIKITDDLLIKDDIINNEFKIIQLYEIDSIWKPMMLEEDVMSMEFVPSNLTDVLLVPNMENRKNDIILPYPVSREHITKIILPTAWGIENNDYVVSNDVFYYNFNINYKRSNNEVILKSYLKTQKYSVEFDEFERYSNDVNELEKSFGYTIFISKNDLGIKAKNVFYSLIKNLFFLFLIIVLILFIINYFNDKKLKKV